MSSTPGLGAGHRGPVIAADDRNFDVARATFNGMIERHPELIVRPLDVADVATAVRFARDADLPVAVRGGGHGVAGHCIGDGSLVVDLRLMREVAVDPEVGTASCGGGSLWEVRDTTAHRSFSPCGETSCSTHRTTSRASRRSIVTASPAKGS